MWRTLKLVFKYAKQLLPLVVELIQYIEPILKLLKEQDWTDDATDKRLDELSAVVYQVKNILKALNMPGLDR